MRINSGGGARERIVWPRARSINRRCRAYDWARRAGQQGNPVSRRSGGYSAGIAVETLARLAGARIREAGEFEDDPNGLSARGGDQPKSGGGGGKRAVPEGSLLPPQCVPH